MIVVYVKGGGKLEGESVSRGMLKVDVNVAVCKSKRGDMLPNYDV